MHRNFISNPSQLDMQKACYRNMINPIIHTDEVWMPLDNAIPDIQPWYMVSNYGRIYSTQSDIIIRQTMINSGYLKVTLRSIQNRQLDLLVHRLVMMAFYPIKNCEHFQINHIDCIKTHNYLSNLEWATNSENLIHAYNNNLRNIGEDHNWAKISESQAIKICEGLENGLTYVDICYSARLPYNDASCGIIYLIKKRKNWKHISNKYNFDKVQRLSKP